MGTPVIGTARHRQGAFRQLPPPLRVTGVIQRSAGVADGDRCLRLVAKLLSLLGRTEKQLRGAILLTKANVGERERLPLDAPLSEVVEALRQLESLCVPA